MENYAGHLEFADHHVGRLIVALAVVLLVAAIHVIRRRIA
jgi:hypothetical protein